MRARIIMVVTALVWAMHGAGLRAEEDSTSTPEDDSISICEQTIAEQMTGAGELQWPKRHEYKVRARDGGDFRVEGYVDRLGPLGTVRNPFVCTAASYGGHWRANFQLGTETNVGATDNASAPPSSEPVARRAPAEREGASEGEAPAEREAPLERVAACRSLRFADVTTDRHTDRGFQVVKGRAQNFGALPIKNLRICALESCTEVRDGGLPFLNGAVAEFTIQVPSLDPVTMSAQCSVIDPS
jgi:hypothetical protein